MAFASLDIPNFRALRNLKVEDLRRVNILVGRNNSGKTSLLEAVELLCALPNRQNLLNILFNQRTSRNKLIHPLRALNSSSHTKAKSTVLSINASTRYYAEKRVPDGLSVKLIYQNNFWSFFPPDYLFNKYKDEHVLPKEREWVKFDDYILETKLGSENLVFNVYGPISNSKFNDFELLIGDKHVALPAHDSDTIQLKFVNVKSVYAPEYHEFDNLALSRKTNLIINSLLEIDRNISDLVMLSDGSLVVDLGDEGMLPIEHLGEGSRRIVRILTAILYLSPGGVCLIDEIDTGLHYTALPVMWKAVLQAAESNDVQVFATTHSDECVEALVEVLREKSEKEGKPLEDADCALYRLEQAEDGTKAHRYDMEMLGYSLKMDWGFR